MTSLLLIQSPPPTPSSILTEYEKYWTSSTCENCHDSIFEQQAQSSHAKSFSNPVFQGQYFQELLPRVEKDPELFEEAKACIACHSPVDFVVRGGRVSSAEQVDPRRCGVICDFCHTITGYEGQIPGNGNFISEPGSGRKLGPFLHKYDWHHVYSELQTKSEFCAICHNAVNHHGLEVKSTYTEWKESFYARAGVECQDCHMNLAGYLVSGKPAYESGRAADSSRTFGHGAPYRSRLYTHRFPGAHSRTQILEAEVITLTVNTGRSVFSPGEEVVIHVHVNNSKTGHKMPSGSVDLRQLWVELSASGGDRQFMISATPKGSDAYDVAGAWLFDGKILGDDIPTGSRIYRTIFIDETGRPTLSSYDAVKILFDNRLNATEIREETYFLKIPQETKGKITFRATLNYLPYPSSFSKRFGLPKAEPFEISSAKKDVNVR